MNYRCTLCGRDNTLNYKDKGITFIYCRSCDVEFCFIIPNWIVYGPEVNTINKTANSNKHN